jgi:hypothetical protein
LVRQRVKSFDGNNSEQSYNSFTTNGGSRNGNGKDESESLSVLRRKQMFESGGASSVKAPTRKSVSDEIKQLQQESLKAAATRNKSPEPQQINNRSPSPAFDHQRQVVSPVRTTSPSPQPVGTQFPFQSKTATHQIKAYNLPFHIGGTVTGKLAEKVNKNSENGVGNINGNGNVEVGKMNQRSSPQATHSIGPPDTFKDKSNTNHIIQRQPSPVVTKSPSPSPTPVATITPTLNSNQGSSPQPQEDGHVTPTNNVEITPEMGLCARALYDYQAGNCN